MHELLILSGKGGAGKTSIAACFAKLAKNALFIDCDVDASNLPLLLSPVLRSRNEFFSGNFPQPDTAKCIACFKCQELCRFDAVNFSADGKVSFADNCEGCGLCADICPANAITLKEKLCGHLMHSTTVNGELFHAELLPGAENSGRLIAKLRSMAHEFAEANRTELIISDGPPGIGCPVISASTGVDQAVIVTEPTVSGIHDMERLATLLRQFEIPFSIIINKANINPEKSASLADWCRRNKIDLLGEIPFDGLFSEALSNGKTVLDMPESPASQNIKQIWNKLKQRGDFNK